MVNMKDIYPEFYDKDEQFFEILWKEALFIFDANVYLDLFRVSTVAAEEFLTILDLVKDRIWLPYIIGLEFHRNLSPTINDQKSSYTKQIKLLEGMKIKDANLTNPEQNGGIRSKSIVFDAKKLAEEINKTIEIHLTSTRNAKKDYDTAIIECIILNRISSILEGKIQENIYTPELIDRINKIGMYRFDNNIPPGYADKGKKEMEYFPSFIIQNKYGDLINWLAITDKGISENISIIFVTNDSKPDWVESNGKESKPRRELSREYYYLTNGKYFYLYNTDKFMHYAKKYFKANISEKSEEAIKEVSRENATEIVQELQHKSQNSLIGLPLDLSRHRVINLSRTDQKLIEDEQILPFIDKSSDLYEIKKVIMYYLYLNDHLNSDMHSIHFNPLMTVFQGPLFNSLLFILDSKFTQQFDNINQLISYVIDLVIDYDCRYIYIFVDKSYNITLDRKYNELLKNRIIYFGRYLIFKVVGGYHVDLVDFERI